MIERFYLPQLDVRLCTLEQLARQRAAHAIADEVHRLEDEHRVVGWERVNRVKALELAAQLRAIATELFERGTVGLEQVVAYERARAKGFPCPKCHHQHEGARYSYRCFSCGCRETQQVPEPPQWNSERNSNPK